MIEGDLAGLIFPHGAKQQVLIFSCVSMPASQEIDLQPATSLRVQPYAKRNTGLVLGFQLALVM